MILLISGGVTNKDLLSEFLLGKHGPVDAIVAADSGVEILATLGTKPDFLVGDFDSFSGDLDALLSDESIVVKRLNPIKDDTDTESALRWIIELINNGRISRGPIVILGATGKRIDHLMANISILGIALEAGLESYIIDQYNRIRLWEGGRPLVLSKKDGYDFVSIFPIGGDVKGLSLEGFKYPLKDFDLSGFNSLGVSNEISVQEATIAFKEGFLLVVEAVD